MDQDLLALRGFDSRPEPALGDPLDGEVGRAGHVGLRRRALRAVGRPFVDHLPDQPSVPQQGWGYDIMS